MSPHASKIKIDYLKEIKLDSFSCIAWHVNTEGFQNISKMNINAYANGEVRAECFLFFHERWNKLIVARLCSVEFPIIYFVKHTRLQVEWLINRLSKVLSLRVPRWMWSRFNIRFCAANLQCARCMTSRNGITYIDTAKCWYCDILGYFFLSFLKFFPYFFNWVICFWNLPNDKIETE